MITLLVSVVGLPGTGKTATCKALVKLHPGIYTYIASGDCARKIGIDCEDKVAIAQTGLHPKETLIREMVFSELMSEVGRTNIILLDGFPRTRDQYIWLMERRWRPDLLITMEHDHAHTNLEKRGRGDLLQELAASEQQSELLGDMTRYFALECPELLMPRVTIIDGTGRTPEDCAAVIHSTLLEEK
jgi:adenylate kinase family enzyme